MNSNQLITNEEALRLFFNDDVYLVGSFNAHEKTILEKVEASVEIRTENSKEPQPPASNSELKEADTGYSSNLTFKYLGKNEKSILILVDDTENPVSTPLGTEILRKLVLSINLKNADFALVNYAHYSSAKFTDFHAFFSCKMIFSFGVSPSALGLADQPLHQLNTAENIKMIFTHNLHALESDLAAKKALWGTLKNL